MGYHVFPGNRYGEVAEAAYNEIMRAKEKHGPQDFHNEHHGYAVLLEEVDELWDEIKKSKPDFKKISTEAVQVAAMAMRIAAELGEYPYTHKEPKSVPTIEQGDL